MTRALTMRSRFSLNVVPLRPEHVPSALPHIHLQHPEQEVVFLDRSFGKSQELNQRIFSS
jgi:hypothetical protein